MGADVVDEWHQSQMCPGLDQRLSVQGLCWQLKLVDRPDILQLEPHTAILLPAMSTEARRESVIAERINVQLGCRALQADLLRQVGIDESYGRALVEQCEYRHLSFRTVYYHCNGTKQQQGLPLRHTGVVYS